MESFIWSFILRLAMVFRKQFRSQQLILLLVRLTPPPKKKPKHYSRNITKYFCLLSWKIFTKSRLPDPPWSFFEFFLNGEVGELTFCMELNFRRKAPLWLCLKWSSQNPAPNYKFSIYIVHIKQLSVYESCKRTAVRRDNHCTGWGDGFLLRNKDLSLMLNPVL